MQDLIDSPPSTHSAPANDRGPVRPDLYGPIHQTLRAGMARTLVALGALDVTDAAECRQVLADARQLLSLVDSHLHHEEVFVHPLLRAAEPAWVVDTEHEHAQHRTAIAMLRAEIDELRARPDATAAQGLYGRFALFVAENHEHMHMEETRLNAVLWAHCDDATLMELHDRIVASIPPDEMAATMAIMLPALTPQQRAGMLGAMQTQAPPEAMRGMFEIADAVLDARAAAKLRSALGLDPARGASREFAPSV